MTETTPTPEEEDVALALYALNLLSASERAEVAARVEVDGAGRNRLAWWEERLAGLADEIPEAAPPPRLRNSVERRIFGVDAPAKPARSGLSAVRAAFAGLLVAGTVAALGLVVAPSLRPGFLPGPQAFDPQFTATLQSDVDDLVILAAYDPEAGLLTATRTSGAARPGRSIQVWLIADGAEAPVAVGVLSEDPVTSHPVTPFEAENLTTGTLAISDEPPGGSPTGTPTGEILATATMSGV